MAKSFKETVHPAEFVLTEEDGHLSRDNVVIAAGQTVLPGTLLVGGAGGYTAFAAGGAAKAIALYGATTAAGETANISAITRLAEVNGKCLSWPAGIDQAGMEAAAVELAKSNIIVRGYPDLSADSPGALGAASPSPST